MVASLAGLLHPAPRPGGPASAPRIPRSAQRAAVACCATGEATCFGHELLTQLGVNQHSVSGTLAAARTLLSLAEAERPLTHLTAEAPVLETLGSGGEAPPWEGNEAAREGWKAAVQDHFAFLLSLGLTQVEAAAVLPSFPYALLLPAGALAPPAEFLRARGLEDKELATLVRAAPRLLGFSPQKHLSPAVAYLEGCGLGAAALLGLLRAQPALLLAAVVHKVRTDSAAAELHAAYQLQAEERQNWAVEMATSVRASLKKQQ